MLPRRRVSQREVLPHPAFVVYDAIADIEEYPEFLPWCRLASITGRQPASSLARSAVPEGTWSEAIECMVDFNFGEFAGIPPESLGGALHEQIQHTVWLDPGSRVLSVASSSACERICYDWKLSEEDGQTIVELDFDIVFRSLVHAPAWDIFARAVVTRVTAAFVERVSDVQMLKAAAAAEKAEEMQAVAVADGEEEERRRAQHMQDESGMRAGALNGVETQQQPQQQAQRLPQAPGDLMFGVSSWLLNTTAAVAGVPLRVVPLASYISPGGGAAVAAGGEADAAAVRAALRRQPRAELIKELQVLERRVAALKSALREQPAAVRPPSERW